MHTGLSLRSLTLSLVVCNFASFALGRVGKDAKGINCYGYQCSWNCAPGSCSQQFVDLINGIDDNVVLHDGKQLACIPDMMSGDGMCAYIHGFGEETTNGTNMKLVAQDLANHCGGCGQAPMHRDNGNQLAGGWYQIESVDKAAIDACGTKGQTALCV